METLNLILRIVAAVVPMIPLVIALINFVKKSIQEKNWKQMVNRALKLIVEAETLFVTGAEKKDYVMKLVKAAADEINYNVDEKALSELIDSIIGVTKAVNVEKKEIEE